MRGDARGRPRRLGIVGTFVWDVIHGRDVRSGPVEEWGGIAYALGALDAALPEGWEVVPIVKVGADLWPRAQEFLRTLRRVAPDASLVEVPYPNNRVELFYYSNERRSEVLRGGVPGWTWPGLAPVVAGVDALLVNFISGFEMDLETAQLLRQHYKGVIYADLHSLTLAVQPGGLRTLRPLPDVAAWCRCFDLVQVNEDELAMMAPDGLALAATALANGVRCLSVTLGRRGAVYFAQPGYDGLAPAGGGAGGAELAGGPARAAARADVVAGVGGGALGPVRTALVPAEAARAEGDPTGCGDVWGATHFSRLLAGDSLEAAIAAAHRAAARNVEHRGATGLASYLRGEIGGA
jgi:sugar/nucleoside kinase (ribokinase family)